MRIALWNGSGLDNVGDRMLDWINRRELAARLPGAEFVTFCPWTDGREVRHLRIDRNGTWEGAGAFDAIVIGGGALLLGPPFAHPGLQTYFLGPYPARFVDTCPVIWNAICTDGQFLAPLFPSWSDYVKEAARRITFKTVRNQQSCEFLQACGVDDAVSVVPDPAVLLSQPVRREYANRPSRLGVLIARPVFPRSFLTLMSDTAARDADCANSDVVLAPSGESGTDFDELLFAKRFAQLLTPLVESGLTVEIGGLGRMYGDVDLARQVCAMVSGATLVEFHDSVGNDACSWARSLDCMIASRLHGCILALLAATPLVAADFGLSSGTGTSKIREFLATSVGLSGYVSATDLLSGVYQLKPLISAACNHAQPMSEVHAQLHQQASTHFDCMAEHIRSKR